MEGARDLSLAYHNGRHLLSIVNAKCPREKNDRELTLNIGVFSLRRIVEPRPHLDEIDVYLLFVRSVRERFA